MPELPVPPARRTQPLTENERSIITATWARPEIEGNYTTLLAVLAKEHPEISWDYQRTYRFLNSSKSLAATAQAADPADLLPTADEVLDRTPVLAPAEIQEAKAIVRQEKLLAQESWTSLGLTEQQGQRMISMERFARQPLTHLIMASHGGIAKCLATLLGNFEDTAMRLNKCLLPSEVDGNGDPRPEIDVERDWHKLLLGYSAEIRALADQLSRSNILLMKSEKLRKEAQSGKKKKRMPGPPVQVLAQPGASVHIHEDNSVKKPNG